MPLMLLRPGRASYVGCWLSIAQSRMPLMLPDIRLDGNNFVPLSIAQSRMPLMLLIGTCMELSKRRAPFNRSVANAPHATSDLGIQQSQARAFQSLSRECPSCYPLTIEQACVACLMEL